MISIMAAPGPAAEALLKGGHLLIEVCNLVKRYDARNAVDRLSSTVPEGVVFGFLEPNGAGKSITMNIMTGYLAATGRDAVIDCHNILDEPEAAKRRVGYLPEQPPLYLWDGLVSSLPVSAFGSLIGQAVIPAACHAR